MSSPRWAVCFGGSNAGSWSLNGSSSRWASMILLMSSPSAGTEKFTKGPPAAWHDENVPWSLYTAMASSVAGDHVHAPVRLAQHRALLAQVVEERVRVVRQLPAAEEIDVRVEHREPPRVGSER